MWTMILDPRAANALNERAEALCNGVKPCPPQPGAEGWTPDVHTKAEITASDIIGEPDIGRVAPEGGYISMSFHHGGQNLELVGEEYLRLRKLVELTAKNSALKDSVSSRTIERVLRHWVRDRFRGAHERPFSDVLIEECQRLVEKHTVWLPIQRLHTQQTLWLGKSRLQGITKQQLDDLLALKPAETREHVERKVRPLQGHAAVVLECVAEPERAMELALEEAELILAVLSPFSPGTLRCRMGSSVTLWGMQQRRTASALIYRGSTLSSMKQAVLEQDSPRFMLDNQFVATLAADLERANWLLNNAAEGSLASSVLDALRVYRRATLTSDPAEKLIFVFTALEMILLSGTSEPIQDSVGTRLAFLIGQSADDRKRIIATMRKGYGLRSAFIHHGAQIDDLQIADELLAIAWAGMIALMGAAQHHRTAKDLVNALEDRKLQ
jgi:hypothetical protein